MLDQQTLDERTETLETDGDLAALMRGAQFETRTYLIDQSRAGKTVPFGYPEMAWSSFLKRADVAGLLPRVREMFGDDVVAEL